MIGDLSKEDALVLVKYGREFQVALEFGCGASTQVLRSVCQTVVSMDTSQEWIDSTERILFALGIVNARWERMPEHEGPFVMKLREFLKQVGGVSLALDDGVDYLRLPFAKEVWANIEPGGVMLFHDTRRDTEKRVVMQFLSQVPPDQLGEVIFNEDRSNLTTVRKSIGDGSVCRWDKTYQDLPYQDWNEGRESWEVGEFGAPQWRKARAILNRIVDGDSVSDVSETETPKHRNTETPAPETETPKHRNTETSAPETPLRRSTLVHICSELDSELERESIRQVKEFCGEDVVYQIHYHPPTRVMPEVAPLFVQGLKDDLRPGHYGCWRAFQVAMEAAEVKEGEFLIVCERDVKFEAPREEVLAMLAKVQKLMTDSGVPIFSFGDTRDLERGYPQSHTLAELEGNFAIATFRLIGLQFLVFSSQGVAFMREAMQRHSWHGMDVWLNVVCPRHKVPMGILKERLTSQLDGPSIIDGMVKVFTKKPNK